jgi:hypothetical protein
MNDRSEVTLPAETPLPDRTRFTVAVYFPGDGYGGSTQCPTMEAAREHARELIRLGYGHSKHPIHIITTTISVLHFEWTP